MLLELPPHILNQPNFYNANKNLEQNLCNNPFG